MWHVESWVSQQEIMMSITHIKLRRKLKLFINYLLGVGVFALSSCASAIVEYAEVPIDEQFYKSDFVGIVEFVSNEECNLNDVAVACSQFRPIIAFKSPVGFNECESKMVVSYETLGVTIEDDDLDGEKAVFLRELYRCLYVPLNGVYSVLSLEARIGRR
jgi:hypothetical protein